MCKITDGVKLCMCAASEKFNHYWTLHRLQGIRVMGQAILLNPFIDIVEFDNKEVLLQRMNEPDVIDAPMQFNEHDKLELNFTLGEVKQAVYIFEFWAGAWRETSEKTIFAFNHQREQFGEIKTLIQ